MDAYEDWRLATNGGIRHKLLSQRGAFREEDADWIMEVVIRSTDLASFAAEVFPAPAFGPGGIVYYRRFYPAGLPALRAVGMDVEGFTSGRPIDPFEIDWEAPADTYEPYLKCTIKFGTCPEGDDEPNPNDPFTFLEISASGSGEFLTAEVNGENILWTNIISELPDESDTGLSQQVTTSEVEWNCRWSQIPHAWFGTVLLPRIRNLMGKVNSDPMPIFFDAPAETILFLTWELSQQFTWRAGYTGVNPVSLQLKFLEKNFIGAPDDTQVTHQHTWRPNKGWWKMEVDGNELFETGDLMTLFQP